MRLPNVIIVWMLASISCMITGEIEKKNFLQKIGNLKRQIKELTYLVVSLPKNQSPTSSIQEPQTFVQAIKSHHPLTNLLMIHLRKIWNRIPPEKHLHQPYLFPRLHDVLWNHPNLIESLSFPLVLPSNHNNHRESKGCLKKTESESLAFMDLPNDMSLMCAKSLLLEPGPNGELPSERVTVTWMC